MISNRNVLSTLTLVPKPSCLNCEYVHSSFPLKYALSGESLAIIPWYIYQFILHFHGFQTLPHLIVQYSDSICALHLGADFTFLTRMSEAITLEGFLLPPYGYLHQLHHSFILWCEEPTFVVIHWLWLYILSASPSTIFLNLWRGVWHVCSIYGWTFAVSYSLYPSWL